MRCHTAALLVAAAGVAVAQYPMTTTSTWSPASTDPSSGCVQALEAIVNECLKTEQPKVDACAENDWGCYCSAQEQVITCFHNCPSDSRAFGAQQQKTQWCAAAKSYGSTSSTIKAAPKTKAPHSAPTHAPHRSGGGSSSSPGSDHNSGSGQGGSNDGGNGAFAMSAPIGGAFAALLGTLALL